MAASKLVELLEQSEGQAWRADRPVSEDTITAAEASLKRRFPGDYREILQIFGGGALYGPGGRVVLIRPDQLNEFNPDPERAPQLADMLIFADDEGDYFYFFDPDGSLKRGQWAIFAVEMGLMQRADAFFVAEDLSSFFERILTERDVVERAWHQSR